MLNDADSLKILKIYKMYLKVFSNMFVKNNVLVYNNNKKIYTYIFYGLNLKICL